MKKSLLFVAALFAAFTVNAEIINVDLSKAEKVASESADGSVSFADGVLTINYATTAEWKWAGAEIPVESLSKVTNISFDYFGNGEGIVIYPYLRDAEGNRWTKDEYWLTLESSAWTSETTYLPDASLWDGQTYAFGDKAFTSFGIIANPGTAKTGTFKIRNVKITAEKGTGINNIAVEAKTTKIMRDGQMLIIRDGKTFNALGAEVK